MRWYFVLIDAGCALLCLWLGRKFSRSDGRAARRIAGFSSMSPSRRAEYDAVKLCRLYGRRCALAGLIFAAGALLDGVRPGMGLAVELPLLAVFLVWHGLDVRRRDAEFRRGPQER